MSGYTLMSRSFTIGSLTIYPEDFMAIDTGFDSSPLPIAEDDCSADVVDTAALNIEENSGPVVLGKSDFKMPSSDRIIGIPASLGKYDLIPGVIEELKQDNGKKPR
jgi:hypothetical protein